MLDAFRLKYALKLRSNNEFDDSLVTQPFEFYNEIFKRMGLNCKVNIILAAVSVRCVTDSSPIWYVNKINIYYKGSNVSRNFIDWSTPIPYLRSMSGETMNFYTNLLIDLIHKENISNKFSNEYVRYVHSDDISLRNREEWNIKIALVEYDKNCLNEFKNLSFYQRVKDGITDWSFDNESNYIEHQLIKEGRKTLNDFIDQNYDLYDKVHNLSLLKYEGEENRGKILFCMSPPNDDSLIRLKEGIKLNDPKNLRTIRKLLEISIDTVFLLSDGENIYGLAKVSAENRIKAPSIEFRGQGCWEFISEHGVSIMSVSNGIPSLPKPTIDQKGFLTKCMKTFGESGYNSKLWDFINEAKTQRHGTMIVITDKAEKEADRLSQNSFPIIANEITDLKIVHGLTSIDGAIMLDPFGRCYSMGCILDGVSEAGLGDSSRGARFNSALRYINFCKINNIKVLVVIVSEDGMIDIKTKNDIPKPINYGIEYNI